MKKKGPFDLAIDLLRNGKWVQQAECNRAANVLEVAGKIEGPKILVQVIQDLATILEREGRTTFAQWLRKAVLPILSALPDEGLPPRDVFKTNYEKRKAQEVQS